MPSIASPPRRRIDQQDSDAATFLVRAAGPLDGEIAVPGAKNSALKLMAASLLVDGQFVLTNVPDIDDVWVMAELLRSIGLEVRATAPGALTITNSGNLRATVDPELAGRIRASVNVLGPLLSRCGRVVLPLPGGDDFGSRPIDLHVSGLRAMGATVNISRGRIEASAHRLSGAEIALPFPSVGATENLLMAGVLARGRTTITNAAREPEIVDLCEFLVSTGARVAGIGTSELTVEGTGPAGLQGCAHTVMPDRVQCVTYIAACATAGGRVDLLGARPAPMRAVLERLADIGVRTSPIPSGLRVSVDPAERLRAVNVLTQPHPGIGTDYQPLFVAMLSVARGRSLVTEGVYPRRFQHADELRRMGACLRPLGRRLLIRGVPRLSGSAVTASDIRAGAALVIAGLAADGETIIGGAHHIDRGYEDLAGNLRRLGADVTRPEACVRV